MLREFFTFLFARKSFAEIDDSLFLLLYLFFIVVIVIYFYFEYKSHEEKSNQLSEELLEANSEIKKLKDNNQKLSSIKFREQNNVKEEKIPLELLNILADVGTGMWRIRRKLIPAGESKPPDELKTIYRPFESTWNKLLQAGLEIKSHDGDIISDGEALQIIAFQPSSEVTRDTVIETLRPTIYYKGRMVQMGEVIVGKPENKKNPAD
jgi:hypothetical protein